MTKPAATIKDVARTAGVSVATVSAVVNERTKKVPLSEKSRGKVLRAIDRLNYKVNIQAKLLRTGRSYMIGVVASDLTQPFTGEIVRLIERVVNQRDYNFLLSDTQNSGEKERFFLELFQQKRVEGILFIGASSQLEEEVATAMVQGNIPVILTERESPQHRIPCVLVDNYQGALLGANHLLSLGRRRIAHIAGPLGNQVSEQRQEGYRQACLKAGLTEHDMPVKVAGGLGLEHGYMAMQQMLIDNQPITGLFAFNDTIALGAMRAIREKGLRIPEDIAVVGFDDIPMAAYAQPALTTVRQPRVEMCEKGVMMLLDILEGTLPRDYHTRLVLQPELVVRES